jgi:uncharacterized protein (TIGR02145 family)
MRIFLTAVLLVTTGMLHAQPTIKNVDFTQKQDKIYISYDLHGQGKYMLSLYYSMNKGASWKGSVESVRDELSEVSPGEGKQIVWNVLNDRDWLIAENLKIKIRETPKEGTFTDPRDGQTYKWVRIGDQVWMAENLNYDQSTHGNDWCYNQKSSNCDTYGRLYDWDALLQRDSTSNNNPSGVQGVCPDGWHVPSDAEWKELEEELGMSQSEADKTGYRGTNEGSQLAGNASPWKNDKLINNSEFGSTGFAALPDGYRGSDGNFYGIGNYGYWWSSTEKSLTESWYRTLGYNNSNVNRGSTNKGSGFSVRCVRD